MEDLPEDLRDSHGVELVMLIGGIEFSHAKATKEELNGKKKKKAGFELDPWTTVTMALRSGCTDGSGGFGGTGYNSGSGAILKGGKR